MSRLVLISTADTDLMTLAKASRRLPQGYGDVVLLNPARLNREDIDRLIEGLPETWAVGCRLLGGRRAFEVGFDLIRNACIRAGIGFLAWPGERGQDLELETASTAAQETVARAGGYWEHGGVENAYNLLLDLSARLRGTSWPAREPQVMPWHGIYRDGAVIGLDEWQRSRRPGRPVVAVAFYRSHWISGNVDFLDRLILALDEAGAEPLPFFAYSLRDGGAHGLPAAVAECLLDGGDPVADCLIMTLSFSIAHVLVDGATVADDWSAEWMDRLGIPVLQAPMSTSPRAAWQGSPAGLSPIDVAMQVALPEFDGRITGPVFCFKEEIDGIVAYTADPERTRAVARLAVSLARLRHKPNSEKRLAIVLSSYPTKNARIGNAVGLDTPASALVLLRALAQAGYDVGSLPSSGDDLIHDLIEAGAYDREYLTREQMVGAAAQQSFAKYAAAYGDLASSIRERIEASWGAAPGEVYTDAETVYFAGLRFGKVILCIQPPRGFGDNPIAIYHDPTLPPTHHYTAFYLWLEREFQADAVVHLGKHGTLEWLPGKALGLSAECFPDALLGAVPLFYPFVVNDPGEGVQAKRRAHAVIIDHLIPPMTRADAYGDIIKLEQLMDEYYQMQTLDPSKLVRLQERIWECVQEANLHRDLGLDTAPEDFPDFLLHLDGYVCELKDAQIRGGLHVFGQAPQGDALVDLLVEMTRRTNEGRPGLRPALAAVLGLPDEAVAGQGASLDELHARTRALVAHALQAGPEQALQQIGLAADGQLLNALTYTVGSLAPRLAKTTDELVHLVAGLGGRFVPAGPSGAPTRGMAHVLPTGRNFYSVDPKTLPSPTAYEVGSALAEATLQRYLKDQGTYPETVGIVVWGTAAMRTHGDDVAEVLNLLGVRPRWDDENRRLAGLEVIPLDELERPRIDVVLRISGFFRDAFPNLVHLVDDAIHMVAQLDEPDADNFVAKHFRTEVTRKRAAGIRAAHAERTSLFRIFGSAPGSYGAGILPLIDEGNWDEVADLARAYEAWGAFAYGRDEYGIDAVPEFRDRFAAISVALKNQDNREHDILDSDDYLQYHGGMIATVRALTGRAPQQYHGDSADPARVRVRGLQEELRKVFRTRAVNPKWIDGMMEHGYKGAFEMAATMDYLFGYDATSDVAEDWMYEEVARRYTLDPTVQEFMREKNPWALMSILRRLFEAAERGMWAEPPPELMDRLGQLEWDLDAYLEEWRSNRVRGPEPATSGAAEVDPP